MYSSAYGLCTFVIQSVCGVTLAARSNEHLHTAYEHLFVRQHPVLSDCRKDPDRSSTAIGARNGRGQKLKLPHASPSPAFADAYIDLASPSISQDVALNSNFNYYSVA